VFKSGESEDGCQKILHRYRNRYPWFHPEQWQNFELDSFLKMKLLNWLLEPLKMHLVYIFNSWKLAKKNFTKV
jgi:hypothetical protein